MEKNESLPAEKALIIVDPVVTPDEAKASWQRYQDIKKAIAEPSDIQDIAGKDFLKKSYWRKLKTYFNIDVQFLEEKENAMLAIIRTIKVKRKNKKTGEYFETEDKEVEYYPLDKYPLQAENEEIKTTVVFSAYYRAIAPNGKFMDGDGHCDTFEKGYPNSYHNAKSTAHTRAKNRAISDLVGGGEVSAEEVIGEYKSDQSEKKSSSKSQLEKSTSWDVWWQSWANKGYGEEDRKSMNEFIGKRAKETKKSKTDYMLDATANSDAFEKEWKVWVGK